jgi:hypothetical protein
MIIDRINVRHVAIFEAKNYSPVGANGDTPNAGKIALERM